MQMQNTVQKNKHYGLYIFLVLNIIIIYLTETVGGGKYFFDTGIIHFIAIIFVFLAFVRIFRHRNIHDPVLQKLVSASIAAMVVFAVSHVIEFINFEIFHGYSDALFANVANMYLISLLLILIGAESFLRIYHNRGKWLIWVSRILIILLAAFTVILLFKPDLISLDTDTITSYIYTAIMLIITVMAMLRVWEIKKHVAIVRGFVNYLFVSVILIAIAILANIYYEFIVDGFKIADYRVIYLAHFGFYLALSLLFLAFGQLNRLGGMLDEIDNNKLQKKYEPGTNPTV